MPNSRKCSQISMSHQPKVHHDFLTTGPSLQPSICLSKAPSIWILSNFRRIMQVKRLPRLLMSRSWNNKEYSLKSRQTRPSTSFSKMRPSNRFNSNLEKPHLNSRKLLILLRQSIKTSKWSLDNMSKRRLTPCLISNSTTNRSSILRKLGSSRRRSF